MHAEWSVECGADDPLIVVPWSDPSGDAAFVDLRVNPAAIDAIPEAESHPPLMQALRALNAARSPVFTAKCDAWEMSKDEISQLHLELGISVVFDDGEEEVDGHSTNGEASMLVFGFASYIDCICRERALFASFPRHEHLLRGITRLAAQFDHPHAVLECVLRPAFLHLEAPQQGYALSIYVKALDESPQRAWKKWSAALADVTAILRRGDIIR
jgi:hypothetical protein